MRPIRERECPVATTSHNKGVSARLPRPCRPSLFTTFSFISQCAVLLFILYLWPSPCPLAIAGPARVSEWEHVGRVVAQRSLTSQAWPESEHATVKRLAAAECVGAAAATGYCCCSGPGAVQGMDGSDQAFWTKMTAGSWGKLLPWP